MARQIVTASMSQPADQICVDRGIPFDVRRSNRSAARTILFIILAPARQRARFGRSGHEANVAIATGEVIEGYLPANAARLVKEWALAHRGELEDNWNRARGAQPLVKIPGLDND